MKALVRCVTAIPFVFALGACGSDGVDSIPVSEPGRPADGPVPETLLEGVWETACLPAASPASSRQYTVSVTGNAFRFGDTTYGDASCLDDSALRDIDTLGSLAERLPDDGNSIEDGVPIDLTIEQVTLTPRQFQVASSYNASMVCSDVAAEWVPGVSQDISNCDDQSGTVEVNTAAPRIDFNLFLVDESGTVGNTVASRPDDRLLFGTLDTQTDPARRPSSVSEEVVFLRR